MKIESAEFLQSAVSPRGFPSPPLPELAFAGKSNVGKSSLINALLGRRGLVKTSSTPGKTQMINFFLINGSCRLVDLPGYGFARAPKHVQAGWEQLVNGYLSTREALRGVVLILDVRREPGELDRQMKAWLDAAGLPALYVANKVDKLKRREIVPRLQALATGLGLAEPPIACSAQTGAGRVDIWRALDRWLDGRAPGHTVGRTGGRTAIPSADQSAAPDTQ